MKNRFDLNLMLLNTLIHCNPPGIGFRTITLHGPLAKEYEILIDIEGSPDSFKITVDDKGTAQLSRGSDIWRIQNPYELEKNKDLLGAVTVNRKGKTKPEFYGHTFEEEQRLLEMYGEEYKHYSAKVGRFLPKLR